MSKERLLKKIKESPFNVSVNFSSQGDPMKGKILFERMSQICQNEIIVCV